MATGFCKNAPPRSRLDTTIQMLLRTPLNKGPHPKRCMKSSPHRNFRQVHQGRSSDDDKFCMDSFLQAQASRLEPAGQRKVENYFDTYGRRHGLQLHPICSFVPLRPKEWLPSLRLSSRFFFERISVTQGFLCISPGVALDKTPSTRGSLQLGVSPQAFPLPS